MNWLAEDCRDVPFGGGRRGAGAASDLRDEIYRIAREALRNAFSHARAHHIEAEIIYAERLFRLRIRDDGQGIAPANSGRGPPRPLRSAWNAGARQRRLARSWISGAASGPGRRSN